MKNIEFARTFLYICDYFGYCKGQTYYITKIKGGYVAQKGNDALHARTLKELSAQLTQHTPKVAA